MQMSLFESFQECSKSISDLIFHLWLNSSLNCDIASIEDDFGRFRAWGSLTGAHLEGLDSLDYRLEYSHDISKTLSVILADIADSARESKCLVAIHSKVPPAENLRSLPYRNRSLTHSL